MRLDDLLRFAGGALRGHRLRTSLSLLGVGIGVASVILLTSLGEGARLYVSGEFAALGSNFLMVLPGKTETTGGPPIAGTAPNDLTVEDGEALVRRIPRVRKVAPIALGSATARFGARSREVTVVGTTSDYAGVRRLRMATGRFLPPGPSDRGAPVCVIGSKIQTEVFGGQNPLGEILRLGDHRYRVIGVIAPRGTTIGMHIDEMVYIPVRRCLRMFDRAGLFRLFVEAGTREDLPEVGREIAAVLAERHDGEEDVTVLTQDALLSAFDKILRVLTAGLAAIAAISLSVAGIGIMNVMLVSVSERTREVGVLKSIGASRGQILAAFLTEAAILSTAGGFAGLAAGLGLGQVLAAVFPDFPIQPPGWAVAAAVLVSISVGILFGALPARRASRLDPVAALARR